VSLDRIKICGPSRIQAAPPRQIPPHVDVGEIYRLTIMIGRCENLCITGLIFGGRLNREVPMAAIAPPLAIILIVALIFYLARRSAYKQRK
jgi:hypothetical protein